MSDPIRCRCQHCQRGDDCQAGGAPPARAETCARDLIMWLQPGADQPPSSAVPVHTRIAFDPSAPWEMVVEFRTGRRGWISWLVGRELLRQGLDEDAGLSDVRIGPLDDRQLRLALRSPSGAATFTLDRVELEQVLDRSYDMVPAAEEFDGLDVDAEAARLEGGPRA